VRRLGGSRRASLAGPGAGRLIGLVGRSGRAGWLLG
jgi:hypothetical protein